MVLPYIPPLAQEDGAEIAVVLKRALAGRPLEAVPAAEIEAALRDFERRRSARCGALIARARDVGIRNILPKSFLARPPGSLLCVLACALGCDSAGMGGHPSCVHARPSMPA